MCQPILVHSLYHLPVFVRLAVGGVGRGRRRWNERTDGRTRLGEDFSYGSLPLR